jgi:hypothetical protein
MPKARQARKSSHRAARQVPSGGKHKALVLKDVIGWSAPKLRSVRRRRAAHRPFPAWHPVVLTTPRWVATLKFFRRGLVCPDWRVREIDAEENVPAQPTPAGQNTRVSSPDEEPWRPSCARQPAGQGKEDPDCQLGKIVCVRPARPARKASPSPAVSENESNIKESTTTGCGCTAPASRCFATAGKKRDRGAWG